jgi:nucleoside-diphosphate-sugar epimerase
MRILVTGASGFIGSHVVRHLHSRGHDVVATGRDAQRLSEFSDIRCSVVSADLSADPIESLTAGCDAIVHCAARASPWGEVAQFRRDNVLATERLIVSARAAKTVSRFVFVSSPSIYFKWEDQFNRDETFAPPDSWPTNYAETKWLAECAVREAADLGPIILRPRAVFGPRDNAIVPRLVAVARRGFFPLPGGGRAWTDVTYVENVCIAVALALQSSREVEGCAFNITNGEPIQFRDLLVRLFGALDIKTRFLPIPRRLAVALARFSERIALAIPGKPEPKLTTYGVGLLGYSQTLCIDAARACLGYRPAVSLNLGLQRFADWWQSNGRH